MGGLGELGLLEWKSAQRTPHWPKRSGICWWKREWWPSEQAGLMRADTAELGSPTAVGSPDPNTAGQEAYTTLRSQGQCSESASRRGSRGSPTHSGIVAEEGPHAQNRRTVSKGLSRGTVSSSQACPWPRWTLLNHSLGTPNPTIRRSHQSSSRKESDTLSQENMVLIFLVLASKELQPGAQVNRSGGKDEQRKSFRLLNVAVQVDGLPAAS